MERSDDPDWVSVLREAVNEAERVPAVPRALGMPLQRLKWSLTMRGMSGARSFEVCEHRLRVWTQEAAPADRLSRAELLHLHARSTSRTNSQRTTSRSTAVKTRQD